MRKGTGNVFLFAFTFGLLFLGCVLRSGVLVDTTFLPRFLFVSSLLLMAWLFGFRKKNIIQHAWFVVVFILFYLWNLLTCFWAVSPSEAIMQSQLVFLSLALFLVISAFCSENASFENIFIRTHLFILLFSFGLAFYKMSTLTYFDPYRIISVSANNNLYAGFLVISLPLVFTGYSINRGSWKYLSLLVAILAIFFIVIIQSRAAYIGLVAGLLVSFIFMIVRYKEVFTRKNMLAGIVSLLLLASGISIFYASLDNTRKSYFLSKIPVWQYFKSYEDVDVDKLLEMRKAGNATNTQRGEFDFAESYYENASLRVIFWKKSFYLVKANPVAGVGAGNWRMNIPSCKEPANPEHTIKNYTYSQPHNEWISIMSELGVVGFILAILLFFGPLILAGQQIVFRDSKPRIAAVFYTAFILGFYLFAAFDFPLKRVEHNVLLFSALAFLLQKVPMKSLNFCNSGSTSPPLRAGEGCRGGVPLRVLLSGAFILLFLFTILLASARIKGEYFTLKMFRNEGKNDDKVIEYCRKAENVFYRITPNTLPLAWFEGVAWYRKGDAAAAMNCFQRALQSTPWEVRVLNDYAASLFSLKRTGEAKVVLLKTIDIDPFFDDARFNLAAMYYFTGNRDSALFQVKQCRNCPKKTDFLQELEVVPGYPQ